MTKSLNRLNPDKKTVVEKSSSGISFGGLLTLLFIGLKLTGHIDWHWVWVLSPLWLPLVVALFVALFIVLILFAIALLLAIIEFSIKEVKKWKYNK